MIRRPSILTVRHRPVLARFAASNVLLAFDFDGTLAPIVSEPHAARMRPRTRALLRVVAQRYPCIVVSGRTLDDVTGRVRGIPLRHVFGTYGHEPAPDGLSPPRWVQTWARRLADRLAPVPGLVIEEKAHSVTVHYRHTNHPSRARATVIKAVAELTNARVLNGPYAIVLLPRRGPDKGVALQRARRTLACETALYVGDDETDEDAFRSDGPERLLSVRVGRHGASDAAYRLDRQSDIDALLDALVALRPGAGTTT